MKRVIVAWAFALVFVDAFPAFAETKPAPRRETPEAVAKDALAALKENRVADFAKAMHPDALKRLKETLLSVVDVAEEKGKVDEALSLFKDARTVDELRQLDDAAFFTAFLEGMMRLQPKMREAFRGTTLDVIGHVPEGPDVAHVVYRATVDLGETKTTKVAVVSLRRMDGGWGMLLTSDIEGMAAMLRREFDRAE